MIKKILHTIEWLLDGLKYLLLPSLDTFTIKQSDVDYWPLTVNSIELEIQNEKFISAVIDDHNYAINKKAQDMGYKPLEDTKYFKSDGNLIQFRKIISTTISEMLPYQVK